MRKYVWLVTRQMPYDRVVGIFEDTNEAHEKYDNVPDKYCPLIYPCSIERLKKQSGYSKRLVIHRRK